MKQHVSQCSRRDSFDDRRLHSEDLADLLLIAS
jgi:hypothetical protein